MNMHVKTSVNSLHRLTEKAVLANLKIRTWTARRYDRGESNEVNSRTGAKDDAARVNKRLVSKTALAKLTKVVGDARAYHERATVPWGIRGLGLLAVNAFLTYRETMAKFAGDFDQARYDFARAYPAERAQAEASGLGTLFNPDDYPEADTIADRFTFALRFSPVPTSGDLRVDTHDEQLDEIRQAVEESTQKAANDAIYVPGTPGQRAQHTFKDSLVENIREMAQALPLLNVFGDPAIADLAEKIGRIGNAYDAKELRDSDAIRACVTNEATKTLEKIKATMEGYL